MQPILDAVAQGWQFVGGGVLVVANGIGSVTDQLGAGAITVIKTLFCLGS